MTNRDRVLVLGAKGLVGSAVCRLLKSEGYDDVIACRRSDLDLLSQVEVQQFFKACAPRFVFMAAGRVGGIHANSTYPWDFIYENTVMAANVLEACRQEKVEKVLMLGSTCIYPRLAEQPIREESLLSGPLESTNEWYAVAKIAGIKMGQALRRQHGIPVISAMPTNLYGPHDNFHPHNSHVLPGLLRRFHDAKVQKDPQMAIWGSGKPRREFLHVDDLARALLLIMNVYDDEEIINVGSGHDITITELASAISEAVGYQGEVTYDSTKPDGTPQKKTDISKLSGLGWKPAISLPEGLLSSYRWFLDNVADSRLVSPS